jgi:hypothetical protein
MGSSTVRNQLIAERDKKYKQTYNDDGTINKDAIAGSPEIPGKVQKERDYNIAKADYNRDVTTGKRKQKVAERRAGRRAQAETSMVTGAEGFAPYQDKVAQRKRAQKAKLKKMQKQSYYTD